MHSAVTSPVGIGHNARQQALALQAGQRPPRWPRQAGGLSGRPTCRIYRARHVWVLEFEPAGGGWIEPAHATGRNGRRLTFRTLADAIAYAERHGLDYRIVPPARRYVATKRSRATALPRSWLARLSRNGRKGEIYHG